MFWLLNVSSLLKLVSMGNLFSVYCPPPDALSDHSDTQKYSAFNTYLYRAPNIYSGSFFLRKKLNYLKFVAIKKGI